MRRLGVMNSCCLTVVLSFLFASGCGDDNGTSPPPVNNGDAYQILENLLFDYQQTYDDLGDADRPGDFDFRPALNAYQAAYDDTPNDPTARFGLAATKLLSLAADTRVNDAFDAWKDYLEAHTPFEVPAGKRMLGVPLGLPLSAAAIDLPFGIVTGSALASVKTQLANDEPLVSDVQDILRTVVLPAVESSIALLTPVAELDDFVYPISPRMQGSVYEDPLELDRVEVMAMLAACKLLQAGIGVAVAYDLQFSSYDADGMYAGLNPQNGTVGVLLPGGAAHMQQVPVLFLEAIDIVDEALDVLQAESQTDPNQDDDIIKIGPSELDQADIDRMQAEDLPDLRNAFSPAGALRTEDWDDSSYTPDTTIRINLLNFFETPVEDFKALLPPYELEIAISTADHHDDDGIGGVSVNIPTAVSYSYYDVYIENGEIVESWEDAYPDFLNWCDAWLANRLAELGNDTTWTGDASFYFSDWQSHPAGQQIITINVYETWRTFISVPEIHWQAQTFAAWAQAVPDPTISGLLPEMTDGAQLYATFGILESDWEPVMMFDWWDGDFWSNDDPTPPPPPGKLNP